MSFDFSNLFVLDLANNHAGKVEHGLRVVQEIGAVVRENNARGALKFQFRQMALYRRARLIIQERAYLFCRHIPYSEAQWCP